MDHSAFDAHAFLIEAEGGKGFLFCGKRVYSLWGGYKTDPQVADFIDMLTKKGMTCVDAHTSGHAPIPILKKMADKLNPKTIVPVHTQHAADYVKHFKHVTCLKDGEAFQVNT